MIFKKLKEIHVSGRLFPVVFTTSGQSYLQFSSLDNEIPDCVSKEKLSWIFHGVIPDLFMCCVSENGRCHVWPQPIEFSSAALSCSMLSHLSVFSRNWKACSAQFLKAVVYSVSLVRKHVN